MKNIDKKSLKKLFFRFHSHGRRLRRLCEASGGRLASLAYTARHSLRSPSPLWKNIRENHPPKNRVKYYKKKLHMWKKNCAVENFCSKKNFEKKIHEFRNFFFSIFRKKIPVEIFYMINRLRMQNFTIIGQGVPEISVGTNRQTYLRIYYVHRWKNV